MSTDWSLDNVETYRNTLKDSIHDNIFKTFGFYTWKNTYHCLAVREYSSASERIYQRLYRHSQ